MSGHGHYFSRVETRRRPEEVVSRLAAAIQDGVFGVGDRLPPERDLADQLGISRAAVREGLALLCVEGIIERRVGAGTFVTSADPAAIERAAAVVGDAEDPCDILEWQHSVEPAIAAAASRALDQDGLGRLQDALDAMRSALERGDRRGYSSGDRVFHLTLAEITKNRIFIQATAQLLEWMAHQLWRSIKDFSIAGSLKTTYLHESFLFHEDLLRAVAASDVARVYEIYHQRYLRVRDVVFGESASESS